MVPDPVTFADLPPRDALRDQVIDAVLLEVPFEGWSDKAIRIAAEMIAVDPAQVHRVFPGGPAEIIAAWHARSDAQMTAEMRQHDLVAMKVREKVTLGVRLRLAPLAQHRDAVRRTIAYMAHPLRAAAAARMLYATIDAIWYEAGDRSTDHNFYTKRGLLAGVYTTTLLYWLDDRSEGAEASWAFLDRRIANVMQVPKLLQSVPTPARCARAVIRPLKPLMGLFSRRA